MLSIPMRCSSIALHSPVNLFFLAAVCAGVMVNEDELDDELVLWGAGRFVEDYRPVGLCAGGGESALDSFVPKASVVGCRAWATLAPFR